VQKQSQSAILPRQKAGRGKALLGLCFCNATTLRVVGREKKKKKRKGKGSSANKRCLDV
jgi:hypothetical protein